VTCWRRRAAHAAAAVRPNCEERGVALVVVLGFLAVMSMITIGIVGAARTAATSASRALVRAQAQAAVESGIDYGINVLLAARGFAPELLAKPEVVTVGGFRVVVSARPEHAKVDLNHASADLLALLFVAGGAGRARADALASAVEDWRDGDQLVRVNGAELRQYEEAGLGYGPANQFFRSADELRLVLGLDRRLYDCVRTEVTILSQRPGLDIAYADPAIRRAAGIDGAAVRGALEIRPGDVFEITARLDDSSRGVRRAERATVRLTGNPSDPYSVLSFEPARPLEEAAQRACPKRAIRAEP
jgi:general secretion pathway protein K